MHLKGGLKGSTYTYTFTRHLTYGSVIALSGNATTTTTAAAKKAKQIEKKKK